MVRVSDLRMRDVVNVVDGRRLGMIKDFDLDVEVGRIRSVLLPGSGKILGFFGRNDDLEIPWDNIIKIGVDVILVNLPSFTDVRRSNESELNGRET
ncbi:MAG: YlmC/YmxH family sporulation protein [Syntrophomonadaceae bacterium]|nr:YlmC/YmxH family sporulation protein [Syntrophomonadaceae bacterium]